MHRQSSSNLYGYKYILFAVVLHCSTNWDVHQQPGMKRTISVYCILLAVDIGLPCKLPGSKLISEYVHLCRLFFKHLNSWKGSRTFCFWGSSRSDRRFLWFEPTRLGLIELFEQNLSLTTSDCDDIHMIYPLLRDYLFLAFP